MPASPSLSDAGEQPKKITFRFCRECSNMLYPKEDRVNQQLMFACRTCQFSEPAPSSCVYRNEQSNTVGDTAGITQDVGSDPTVGLPGFCAHCGEEIVCIECEKRKDSARYEDDEEEETRVYSSLTPTLSSKGNTRCKHEA